MYNNNLITSLIMNVEADLATPIEESFILCNYSVDELDCPDISNIDHINEDIILSWQKIIRCGSKSIEIDTNMDINYNHHKSNSSSHRNSLAEILELIIGEIKMLEEYLTKIESSYLDNNPEAIIFCGII